MIITVRFMHKHRKERVMDVKIENGKLLISIELQEPTPSASGKTLVVATTHGKNVVIGLNAYIKK
jgi:hypothetical protein